MPPTPSWRKSTNGPNRSGNCWDRTVSPTSLEPLADQSQRRAAERQQPVVECAEALRPAFLEEHLPQLHDLQFSQRVAQISGIEGAAISLLQRVAGIDETLLTEQRLRLFDLHPLRVKAD